MRKIGKSKTRDALKSIKDLPPTYAVIILSILIIFFLLMEFLNLEIPSEWNYLLVLLEKSCVIIVAAYLITRAKFFTEILDQKLNRKNQALMILIFGFISIYGTYSNMRILGAIANVRDIGPMIAGIVAGPIAGIGAGIIGGLLRLSMGGLTSIPCSLATVLAGFLAGLVYLLNKKRFVGVAWTVIFAVLMESLHMILVLFLAKPFSEAMVVVKSLALPMILANAWGVFIFALIISNRIQERKTKRERDRFHDELEAKKHELRIAHKIQESFLPDSTPELEGFQLSAVNIPALEVGGDFYDFIPVSADMTGIVIADVSGKSVPAALFMALSRTVIRAKAQSNKDVAEVIKEANKMILEDSKSSMFVTLFYAVLDQKSRTLRYVDAGHNPPLYYNERLKDPIMLKAKGIALGVMDDIELEEKKLKLEEGDVIVFYTDGVTEALNAQGEFYGMERLFRIVKENHRLSAQEIMDKIQQSLGEFCGSKPQFDDITLAVLKAE